MMSSRFLFTACQIGSEPALKAEIARRHPGFRFAFSRPGFCTFRIPDEPPGGRRTPPRDAPHLDAAFARTSGLSLGKATGSDNIALARGAWQALAPTTRTDASQRPLSNPPEPFRHLHVWQRDGALAGDLDLDPDAAAHVRAAGEAILAQSKDPVGLALNEHAAPGDAILDCVIVEPGEWWLGWHRASAAARASCWPGGVPNLAVPADMISRAYLKIAEALLWAELPVAAGDRCVEIGSAPGGSCQALLERGCVVVGLDPAEMDERVLAHPRFTHVRARAKDAQQRVFDGCRWLVSDANVAPTYTLDTVEPIVTRPEARIDGLLLTLKLTDEKLAAELPSFEARIRAWGYGRVRSRQLAFNRREVCVAARR
jgi:23S rRNA (cytidine2498-2'-O)-methyltransferase